MMIAKRGRQLRASAPLGLLALGAVIGLSVGMAFGQTVNCSHTLFYCQGTSEGDNISGWENFNEIEAKAGRDQVWAYGSFDVVHGSEDGDNVNGGEGADSVYGETGNDSNLVIGGGAGVYGQSQDDHLYGGVGDDLIEGDSGSDVMYGNEHDDVFFAEDGTADTVDGNSGSDICYVDGYDTWSNCTAK
jgi:Ca2+-binding RTX toxin-like protein